MSKFNATVSGSNVVVIGDNSVLTVGAEGTQSKIIIAQELQQFFRYSTSALWVIHFEVVFLFYLEKFQR